MRNKTRIIILMSLLPILLVACSNNGSSKADDTTDTLAVTTQCIAIDIEQLKAPDKPLPTVGYDKIISPCQRFYHCSVGLGKLCRKNLNKNAAF